MKENTATVSGVLNINKPAGITSHDVVNEVRRITGQRRVGHAGTLDPFATGVLLVGINAATKLLARTHAWPKIYDVTVVLGAVSDTDDGTGHITPVIASLPAVRQAKAKQSRSSLGSPRLASGEPRDDEIQEVLRQFIGTIQQIPPQYAAIKVKGKKLYEYARAGETVARETRRVTIHTINVLSYNYPELRLKVTCSTGTYIRALARDVGTTLGIGGYAAHLTRLAIGPFTVADAVALEQLTATTWQQYLLSGETLLRHLERDTGHLT